MSKERQRLMKFREMYKQKETQAKSKSKSKETAPQPPILEEQPVASSSKDEVKEARAAPEAKIEDEAPPTEPVADKTMETKPEEEERKNDQESHQSRTQGTGIGVIRLSSAGGESGSSEMQKANEDDGQTPTAETQDKSVNRDSMETTKRNSFSQNHSNSNAEQLTEQDPNPTGLETPTTEHPAGVLETYSPTSILEFSGKTSTRPTSVSEVSEEPHAEKANAVTMNGTVDERDLASSPADETPVNTADATPTPMTPNTVVRESPKPGNAPTFIPTSASALEDSLKDEVYHGTDPSNELDMEKLQPPIQAQRAMSASSSSLDDEMFDDLKTAEVKEVKHVAVTKSPMGGIFPRSAGFRAFSAPYSGDSANGGSPTGSKPGVPMVRLRSVSSNTSTSANSPTTSDGGVAVVKKIEGGIAAKIADLQRSFSKNSGPTTSISGGQTVAQRAAMLQQNESPTQSPGFTPTKRIVSGPGPKRVGTATPETKSSPITAEMTLNDESEITALPVVAPGTVPMTPISQVTTIAAKRSSKRDSFSLRNFMISTKPTIKEPQPPTPVDTPMDFMPVSPPAGFTHHRARSSASARPAGLGHPSRSASVSSFRSISGVQSHPGSPTPSHSEVFGQAGSRRSIDGWRSSFSGGSRSRRKSDANNVNNRASQTLYPGFLPRNVSSSSLDTSFSGESGGNKEKKASRTSRLLKRMSSTISSLANGSRTQLQTWNERAPAGGEQTVERMQVTRPGGIGVGDLNVQFPDTLVSVLASNASVKLTNIVVETEMG
jgi:hypothetical protein